MPVESLQSIYIEKDGSGMISRQIFFHPFFSKASSTLELAIGRKLPNFVFGEAAIPGAAKKMGSGVRYLSHESCHNEAGWKGYQAYYQFNDINRLKIDYTGFDAKVTRKINGLDERMDTRLRFFLDEDELNVVIPHEQLHESGLQEWPIPFELPLQRILNLVKGFRFGTAVIFDTPFKFTNASFNQDNQTIVLFDFAIDPILNTPGSNERLKRMTRCRNISELNQVIGDIDAIKLEPRPIVRVER